MSVNIKQNGQLTPVAGMSNQIYDSLSSYSTTYSSNKINSLLPIWTTPVTALTGATSATIQNANIHTTSVIEPFADNGTNTSMATPTQTVTEGQCVLGFEALSADTSFMLRVTNL